jgi:hypothetical protein
VDISTPTITPTTTTAMLAGTQCRPSASKSPIGCIRAELTDSHAKSISSTNKR